MEDQKIFPEPDVIDLAALFRLLWKKKFIILGTSFLVAVITAVITLQMPNIYQSTTTLLPVSSDSNSLGQYASLAAMAGVSLPSKSGTEVEKIMAVLNSRTLKERIIEDLDLTERILKELPEKVTPLYAATEMFTENYSAAQDKKSGLITISYKDKDPELAADVVNYTAALLGNMLDEKSLTISSKKLELTEMQLNSKKDDLEAAKNRLVEFQRRTQVLQPETQAKGVMELYTALVQQKISLEVELETLGNALSATNPRIRAKEQQLEAVENQLNNMSSITSDGKFDTTDVPENIAEYTEIISELEIAQKMYLSLYAQWEQLKMQEQDDQIYVEVIDEGIPSEIKNAPFRLKIVLLGSLASLLIILLTFVLQDKIKTYSIKRRT